MWIFATLYAISAVLTMFVKTPRTGQPRSRGMFAHFDACARISHLYGLSYPPTGRTQMLR